MTKPTPEQEQRLRDVLDGKVEVHVAYSEDSYIKEKVDEALGVYHIPPHPKGECQGCDNRERMKMGNALNEAAAKLDSAAQELAAVDIDFAQQKEDIAALLESLSSALVGIANALSAAGTAFMEALAAESQANPE